RPKRFRPCLQNGLEGIVLKRKDSAYRSGCSPDWLKEKNSVKPPRNSDLRLLRTAHSPDVESRPHENPGRWRRREPLGSVCKTSAPARGPERSRCACRQYRTLSLGQNQSVPAEGALSGRQC